MSKYRIVQDRLFESDVDKQLKVSENQAEQACCKP